MSNKIYLIQYIMLVQVFHCIINYFGIFNLCLVTNIINLDSKLLFFKNVCNKIWFQIKLQEMVEIDVK